jgi:hypothetical protein
LDIRTACGAPTVGSVVAAGVTQVDAAGERDLALGCVAVADDDELLVMRPADPDALIE